MLKNLKKKSFFFAVTRTLWTTILQHIHVTIILANKCVTHVSTQGIPFASHAAEFVKFLLSNVYLNITKELACQSPADG